MSRPVALGVCISLPGLAGGQIIFGESKRVFEKSWQIMTHGTRTRVRPSCLEAGMGKDGRLN